MFLLPVANPEVGTKVVHHALALVAVVAPVDGEVEGVMEGKDPADMVTVVVVMVADATRAEGTAGVIRLVAVEVVKVVVDMVIAVVIAVVTVVVETGMVIAVVIAVVTVVVETGMVIAAAGPMGLLRQGTADGLEQLKMSFIRGEPTSIAACVMETLGLFHFACEKRRIQTI